MVRVKNRYLLAEWTCEERGRRGLSATDVLRMVRHSLVENFGDLARGKADGWLHVLYLNPATGTVVLRTPRETAEEVRGALTLLSESEEGLRVAVRVVGVSGSMRTLLKLAEAWIDDVVLGVRHTSLPPAIRARLAERRSSEMDALRGLGKF